MTTRAYRYIEKAQENTRTFGVEIEFIHPEQTRPEVAEILERRLGLVVESRGYTHEVTAGWKLTHDSTVAGSRGGDPSGSRGSELVSPILRGKAGLDEVYRVLQVVNGLPGVKVDVGCGVHIHHGVPEADGKTLKHLVQLYSSAEALIDTIVPLSRRENNNRWCRSLLHRGQVRKVPTRVVTGGARAVVDYMDRVAGGRYVKLNIQSWRPYGTVEFRQHGGSTDPEKIIPWIIFTQTMVEAAVKMTRGRRTVFKDWKDLKKVLRKAENPMWTPGIGRWITRRQGDFLPVHA